MVFFPVYAATKVRERMLFFAGCATDVVSAAAVLLSFRTCIFGGNERDYA